MEVTGVVNGTGLVGDLKAALTHSEVHRVHVNLSWNWFVFRRDSHVGLLILEDWDGDLNFFASSFSN